MARIFTPQVNRHVTYYDINRKPRPATITSIAADSNPVLRAARGDATTWGNPTNGVPSKDPSVPTATQVYAWWPH